MARQPEEIKRDMENAVRAHNKKIEEIEKADIQRLLKSARVRLFAEALSTLATSLCAVGVFTPFVGLLFAPDRISRDPESFAFGIVCCVVCAAYIYYEGHLSLEREYVN